ncbi:MAG: M28 family metallopeptidase [bacterium]|nr:M28 family metallopeptidase [bacterium]
MEILPFLKSIAFERIGGSTEEKKTSSIIIKKLNSFGAHPYIERFKILSFKPGTAQLTVIKPYNKTYKAYPVGLTGSAKIKGNLRYLELGTEKNSGNIKDKIILIKGRFDYKNYKALIENKAKGFICIDPPEKKLSCFSIEENFIKQSGKLPGINIDFISGLELLQKQAKEVIIESSQKEYETTSNNVIAEIKGSRLSTEVIIVCAHYDSVATSKGVMDNGTGSATILALSEYFLKNPVQRTLRFIWFGSEELGLRGSMDYVTKHKDKLEEIKMVLNIDMSGDILGKNIIIVTGNKDIEKFFKKSSITKNAVFEIRQSIHSSDSLPFAKNGIPGVGLSRYGGGTFYIHTSEDNIEFVNEESLQIIKNASQDFIKFIGNAKKFPFKREIPDSLKKKIREYYTNRRGM